MLPSPKYLPKLPEYLQDRGIDPKALRDSLISYSREASIDGLDIDEEFHQLVYIGMINEFIELLKDGFPKNKTAGSSCETEED